MPRRDFSLARRIAQVISYVLTAAESIVADFQLFIHAIEVMTIRGRLTILKGRQDDTLAVLLALDRAAKG